MSQPKIYLAGPEVFLPDAVEAGLRKKGLCREFGFVGLYPLDNEISGAERRDERIYAANLALIAQADAAIFNLTPFRGMAPIPARLLNSGIARRCKNPVSPIATIPGTILPAFARSLAPIQRRKAAFATRRDWRSKISAMPTISCSTPR